jgi:hypothetical protein
MRISTFLKYLACWVLFGVAIAASAQEKAKPQDEPEQEEKIRDRLRRLNRWQIRQLLYTESQVDGEQKLRANTSTNGVELGLLADDEDSGVRFYVATNRHTPLGVLWALAADPVSFVRSGVALNLRRKPLASKELRQSLEELALRLAGDRAIRLAAQKRIEPLLRREIRDDVLERWQ